MSEASAPLRGMHP